MHQKYISACPANGHWTGSLVMRKIIKVQLFQKDSLLHTSLSEREKYDLFFIICPWANNSHVFLQSLRRGEGTCCSHFGEEALFFRLQWRNVKTTSLPSTFDFLMLSTWRSSVAKKYSFEFIILAKKEIKPIKIKIKYGPGSAVRIICLLIICQTFFGKITTYLFVLWSRLYMMSNENIVAKLHRYFTVICL